MPHQNRLSADNKSQRRYPRAEYSTPILFKSFSVAPDQINYNEDFEAEGTAKNISPGGVLFQTEHAPPKLSSVLWMDLDMKAVKTITLGLDTGKRPLIFENGLLGKVVHIEEDLSKHVYQVGISFVTKFNASLP